MVFRYGRCEKAGCLCTKAHARRLKQLEFQMCKCGHPFEAHAVLRNSLPDEDGSDLYGNRVPSSEKVSVNGIL